MENKTKISAIIKRFLSQRFSPSTEERVQRWLLKDEHSEEKANASLEYWNELKNRVDPNTYAALERVNEKIGYIKRKRSNSIRRKITGIAAVLVPVLLIAGSYFYYAYNNNKLIEIHASYGERKHFFLPDSSEVWINAGTNLKYPKKFKADQRTLFLDGEAYFSVRENKDKPFIVETQQLSVKVLGTKFNVKAYSSETKTITTLTSGKVEVTTNKNDYRVLNPNEQLVFDHSNSIIDVTEIPSNETDSWRTGQLVFNDASFDEIMQTLERHFNTSIITGTNFTIDPNKRYTVKFLKDEDIDMILMILEDVIGFSYQRNGSQIELTNSK